MAAHSTEPDIDVEVAYALPERQLIVALRVPVGTTAIEAVQRSRIEEQFEGLDAAAGDIGIFGRKVRFDRVLDDGDRVEIYRPLLMDPKEARRQLARVGKTMGKRRRKATED